MARKLKVYQARIGFFDTVVAAPNQAAALRAWDTHRNLFADGTAQPATDEAAIEAALAHPEVPLRRGLGSDAPFSLDPAPPSLPDVAPAKRKPAALRLVHSAPPPPDRSALAEAEAALRRAGLERRREEDQLKEQQAALDKTEEELRHRRTALEAEGAALRRRHDVARRRAEQAVEHARHAFIRAGGDPEAES